MLHRLIKTRNIDKVNPKPALNIDDLQISDREQTIRKVTGYIPYSLRKHYRKVSSDDKNRKYASFNFPARRKSLQDHFKTLKENRMLKEITESGTVVKDREVDKVLVQRNSSQLSQEITLEIYNTEMDGVCGYNNTSYKSFKVAE